MLETNIVVDTDKNCDLLVVGSGASGLTTAVTAAWLGLDVIVVEKDAHIGGTSAWSGGWLWIPRNPLAVTAGIVEDIEAPRTYLKSELGDAYDDAFATMLLEQGPRMVAFMQKETSLAFVDGNTIPDFHDTSPGAAFGGRSLCAAPFDGRLLGTRINDLKPPLDGISPFGMGIAAGQDLRHFLNATRAIGSFKHVARRIVRHGLHLTRHGRGVHLVNGNALIARLLKSADDLGVTILKSCPARGIIMDGRRVAGIKTDSAASSSRPADFRTTQHARPQCFHMRRPDTNIGLQLLRTIPAMAYALARRQVDTCGRISRMPRPGRRFRFHRRRMARSAAFHI
jgi:glycine/D-amino acid oxidase-like deaminating enzyme